MAESQNIDSLGIEIEADSKSAYKSITKLAESLQRLANVVPSLQSDKLNDFSNSVKSIRGAFLSMNGIGTRKFDKLIDNMQKLEALNTINTDGLIRAAEGLRTVSDLFSSVGDASKSSLQIARISDSMVRLGNMDMTKVTSQIPQLANALRTLMQSLSSVGTVNRDIVTLISSISKMSGDKMQSAISMIPKFTTAFKQMMSDLQNAPQVSSQIVTLAESMAKLSENGKGAEQAVNAVSDMASNMGKASSGITQIFGNTNLGSTISGVSQLLTLIPGVGTEVATIGMSVGSVVGTAENGIRRVVAQFTNLIKQLTISHNTVSKFASAVGMLYARFWLLIRVIKGLGKAVESSMNYIEEYNYFNVTTEKIAKEWGKTWEEYGYKNAESYVGSFTERMSELLGKMTGFEVQADGTLKAISEFNNLGLDITSLMNYSAGLMQVTNSLGMTGEATMAVSKALTMLSGDMASFRNLDMETAMNKLQSGLIGQSRALYSLGIDITNATLQEYAYANGVEKAVKSMTQSEKMQLRMLAILDQSKVAWGDLANTINSPSNQLRMLSSNWSKLTMVIGNLFLPLVQKILPVVNALVITLQKIGTWIGTLLGIDLSSIINDSSVGYSDAFEEMSDSAEDAEDAVDGIGKAVKKLKGQLQGFDELNNLTTTDNSGSGKSKAATYGVDLTDALKKAMEEYEKVWNQSYERMKNTAQNIARTIIKALEPAMKAFTNLWNDGLAKFNKFNSSALISFLNDFLKPLAEYTLGDNGIVKVFNVTNRLLNWIDWNKLNNSIITLNNALLKIGKFSVDALITFYTKFLAPVGAWTMGNALPTLANIVSKFANGVDWNSLNESFGKFLETLSKLTTFVFSGLIDFVDKVIEPLAEWVFNEALTDLFNFFYDFSLNIKWKSLESSISNLNTSLGNFSKSVENFASSEGVSKFVDILGKIVAFFLNTVVVGQIDAWSTELNILSTVVKATKTDLDNFKKTLEKVFSFKDTFEVPDLLGFIKTAWDAAKHWWDNNKPTLSKISDGIEIPNISNILWQGWEKARTWWKDSKLPLSSITVAVENIASKLQSAWQGAVDFWNQRKESVVGFLKTISISIPNFVEELKTRWKELVAWWKQNAKLSVPTWMNNLNSNKASALNGTFADDGLEDLSYSLSASADLSNSLSISDITSAITDVAQQEMALMRQEISLLQDIVAKEFTIGAESIYSSVKNSDRNTYYATGKSGFAY